jgi:hypothetical protein
MMTTTSTWFRYLGRLFTSIRDPASLSDRQLQLTSRMRWWRIIRCWMEVTKTKKKKPWTLCQAIADSGGRVQVSHKWHWEQEKGGTSLSTWK